MQIPLTVGSFFILVRAVFCISANLTVNESIVGKKYPYLQTADRQFWNFFDRGVLANCLQFWLVGNPRPDWALIYQREQQVHSPADSHIILQMFQYCTTWHAQWWPVFRPLKEAKAVPWWARSGARWGDAQRWDLHCRQRYRMCRSSPARASSGGLGGEPRTRLCCHCSR